jgi:hypothetical protein
MAWCKMTRVYATVRAPRAMLIALIAAFGVVGLASCERTAAEPMPVDARTEQAQASPPSLSHPSARSNGATTVKAPAGGARLQNSIGSGNPLWAIPLASLTATRQRPIFSPSRRPPPKEAAFSQSSASAAMRAGRPPLALVGAIAGEGEGIAIFLDETTKRIVRLKTGESHAGWTLRQVKAREATLQRDRDVTSLALPGPPAK